MKGIWIALIAVTILMFAIVIGHMIYKAGYVTGYTDSYDEKCD